MNQRRVLQGPRLDERVIGQQYGKDTVIGAAFRLPIGIGDKQQTHSFVVVERGGQVSVRRLNTLRVSNTETSKSRQAQHKREYDSWRGMIERSSNPNHASSKRYSERGITVCKRWRESFANFLADMGPRKADETIERKNNDLGYSPENCIWATMAVQRRNQSSNIIWFEKDGVRMCLQDWCNQLGVPHTRVRRRVGLGWSLEKALFTSLQTHPKHEIDGVRRTVGEWAAATNQRVNIISNRLTKGWSAKEAVFGRNA